MSAAIKEVAWDEAMKQYGSPINLINVRPYERNIAELKSVAANHNLNFEVYFARKANKCLAFVNAAQEIGCGIDVASAVELRQVLTSGFEPHRIICTAAIKTEDLLHRCIANEVTIAVDNVDEIQLIKKIAMEENRKPNIALRLSGFQHRTSNKPSKNSAPDAERLYSRFGFDVAEIMEVVEEHFPVGQRDQDNCQPVIHGIHFHLDGYCCDQRVSAIDGCLTVIDQLRDQGHAVEFLDIGGGIPMSYLDDATQWSTFWNEHEKALLNQRTPLTYRNHGLGLINVEGKVHGTPKSYPYYQRLTRAIWLDQILSSQRSDSTFAQSSCGDSTTTIADAIRQRNLQLRCEPGRSILDGCGMTVARVEFRKRHRDGHWLIGLAMNRTQCRTSSDDFLVDPLLIRGGGGDSAIEVECDGSKAIEGFLVGAYCTESELLSLRRLHFPNGVAIGDLVIFPNTAGYLMHFLESRSHQFPLAKNIIFRSGQQLEIDSIDEL